VANSIGLEWRFAPARALSCTIIVSSASEWMTPYHHRMPVLLRPEDFDAWLSGALGADALKPASGSALREWPVSKRMNRTGDGDDDPNTIEEAARNHVD
jgi:putative SOS response-associated peptidase YedK